MWLVGKGNNRTKTNRTKGVSLRDKEHWLYLAVHPQDLHLLTHWTPVYGFRTKSCALRRMESETTIERCFRTIESFVIESDDINGWMRLPLTVQQLCKIKSGWTKERCFEWASMWWESTGRMNGSRSSLDALISSKWTRSETNSMSCIRINYTNNRSELRRCIGGSKRYKMNKR